jgi:hypothetical protein
MAFTCICGIGRIGDCWRVGVVAPVLAIELAKSFPTLLLCLLTHWSWTSLRRPRFCRDVTALKTVRDFKQELFVARMAAWLSEKIVTQMSGSHAIWMA